MNWSPLSGAVYRHNGWQLSKQYRVERFSSIYSEFGQVWIVAFILLSIKLLYRYRTGAFKAFSRNIYFSLFYILITSLGLLLIRPVGYSAKKWYYINLLVNVANTFVFVCVLIFFTIIINRTSSRRGFRSLSITL